MQHASNAPYVAARIRSVQLRTVLHVGANTQRILAAQLDPGSQQQSRVLGRVTASHHSGARISPQVRAIATQEQIVQALACMVHCLQVIARKLRIVRPVSVNIRYQ